MTTITFESRIAVPPESRQFYYNHTAKTWLLLSGFLPTDEDTWQNNFTGTVARLKIAR